MGSQGLFIILLTAATGVGGLMLGGVLATLFRREKGGRPLHFPWHGKNSGRRAGVNEYQKDCIAG